MITLFFIFIFQTLHFSAVKVYMGNEKNMSFFRDTKIFKVEKSWKDQTGHL